MNWEKVYDVLNLADFSLDRGVVADVIGPLSMIISGMQIGSTDFKKVLTQKSVYIVRLILYPAIVIIIKIY